MHTPVVYLSGLMRSIDLQSPVHRYTLPRNVSGAPCSLSCTGKRSIACTLCASYLPSGFLLVELWCSVLPILE